MWKLNKPGLTAKETFDLCVSGIAEDVRREQFALISDHVAAEAARYDTRGLAAELFQENEHADFRGVAGDELRRLYTQWMVPKDEPGRAAYDKILNNAPHKRCFFCGIGFADTLDHYLPKTKFPVFSVIPDNLVPMCRYCQDAKRTYCPLSADEQVVHPYYDDFDHEIWLFADVIESIPASFRFYADPPGGGINRNRLMMHFEKLKLGTLFSSNAGSELAEIRNRLDDLLASGGPASVRVYLNEEIGSMTVDHLNTWKAALYRATVASDWFCEGGFSPK
ncbi:MAG: hypothetical protein IPN69_12470 [Acidobacteria bacterium]|nr:hypothetical protein [Acidobacteriota bacterium]MBK8811530.1 hypothetical protein [Acidobacteriota bacterium]